ncbi:MAG TPA: saccharopine dehydrogenase NADP-binding domain-containing protein [Thermoanaerobaculia bacterium]|nr:saccharopine dehydrogenase NADP-binding domain-containing protein [Thermoanaerobaculia bacterium]
MTAADPTTEAGGDASTDAASPPGPWLLYGANGYTGELVAREAVRRGLRPLLAGRSAGPVEALAAELGLETRVFPLGDPGSVRAQLAGVAAVLHCAGPFVETAKPMVRACLDTGTHYLDITGEIGVFERVLARDESARRCGAVLVPGVGFDVVPTDCTAARVAAALPDADHLELAFVAERGGSSGAGLSRGTARTMVRNLPGVGAERRDGAIVRLPLAAHGRSLELLLPSGEIQHRWVMSIPWGDVSTAFHTTGIPNIRVYTGVPPGTIRRLRRLRPLVPLAGLAPVRALLERWVERRFADQRGPGEEARREGRVTVWGRATAPSGATATSVLVTPESYAFTAASAVECVRRVLAGEVEPGAWTPARAFGPELVEALPGVEVGEVATTPPS